MSVTRLTVPSAKTLAPTAPQRRRPTLSVSASDFGRRIVDRYTGVHTFPGCGCRARRAGARRARRCAADGERSVTGGGTAVGEGLAGLGHELPRVAVGVEGELHHSEGVVVTDFAVGQDRAEAVEAGSARSDDEVPEAARVVELSAGVHRGEPFVLVVVA